MTTEDRLKKLEWEFTVAKRVLLSAVALIVGGLFHHWIVTRFSLSENGSTLAGWALVVGGLLGLIAWYTFKATNQAQAIGKTLETICANEFILKNREGTTRAVLGMNEEGPGLILLDENGKVRSVLKVTKDGPGLVLTDENGKPLWKAL
jgi:hypothetical protein